mgnify:CR=1 FL=1
MLFFIHSLSPSNYHDTKTNDPRFFNVLNYFKCLMSNYYTFVSIYVHICNISKNFHGFVFVLLFFCRVKETNLMCDSLFSHKSHGSDASSKKCKTVLSASLFIST